MKKRRIVYIAIGVLVFFIALVGLRFFFTPIVPRQANTCVVFAKHEHFQHFVKRINAKTFMTLTARIYLRFVGNGQRLQYGEYCFNQHDSSYDVVRKLIDGRVALHPLIIKPGSTYEALLMDLHHAPFLQQPLPAATKLTALMIQNLQQFCDKATCLAHPKWQAQSSKQEAYALEGLLLPDTYYLAQGSMAVDVMQPAFSAMQHFLQQVYPKRDSALPYHNPYEVLIAASIIEKESADSEDRRKISGVIVNRLEKHMPLQMDPVVSFGEHLSHALTHENLRQKGPYNIYLHKGLPPTPICFPSKEAILAALHPIYSDYLYFVAKKDGKHQFSVTLRDHNRAIHAYLLSESS